jgi:hypothetical protein
MTTYQSETPSSSPEALAALGEYLELALSKGVSFIVVRRGSDSSALYIGDASAPADEWTRSGSISNAVVSSILEATQSGRNDLLIGGQPYRFLRTFTQVENDGAIVFTPV